MHMNGLDRTNLEKINLADLAKWVQISAGLLNTKTKAKELAEELIISRCSGDQPVTLLRTCIFLFNS